MEYRAIRKLPEEIIGKIAAGEVVESPAAAIKELVENSLDAGARNVTVEIRDGGISYLRVTDNGSGIRREDVRMAFERHATSKIAKADDLFHLSSLGFRGEALASIAAVAKVTLTTRTPQDERGTRVICQGGVIEEIADAASPEGTTIVARDLFYNTPVRLKFLKKPSTEARDVYKRQPLTWSDNASGKAFPARNASSDWRGFAACTSRLFMQRLIMRMERSNPLRPSILLRRNGLSNVW